MEVPRTLPGAGLLRVGIDVGGTFTDVVVLDAASRAIVARVKVPTTHDAPEGVAAGIVAGLRRALEAPGVDARRIAFIAHSTTQATNALLEGDVAAVGIVGLLGRCGFVARQHLRVPPIRLGPSAVLTPRVAFARAGEASQVERAVVTLLGAGVESIVASEAFGVDRPEHERSAADCAREHGALATAGHDVASSYGLRARTRTAVVNAAILPRMLRTAEMTADAVARAGIAVPLMIMRSDGGVMDVREVARRPILTMLSGPAAGIAGALLHENVTDGIFIEVGGTSADCSVIRRGLPQMRPARVGGHRTMLRTLDVRTLAIAGGSLPRVDPRARGRAALRDVGPRSAHIAGLHYACFIEPQALAGARVAFLRPQAGDPDDYLALELSDGTRAALTPTCAANLLGYVREGDFARGDAESARLGFGLIAERLGCAPEEFARALLACASAKLRVTLDELIEEYELDRRDVELVGGGGGAAALVPFAAEATGLRFRLARDAEVISPIGVALALVRDVVERTIPNPTPDDVVRVRREAVERVVAAGAAPEFVEVAVELDVRRNLVRATASGATAAVGGETFRREASEEERLAAAARALHVAANALECVAATEGLTVFRASAERGRIDACAVDRTAVVRLTVRDASVCATTAGALGPALTRCVEGSTSFGDVGRALPEVYLLYSARLAALGALAEIAQVRALAEEELRGLPEEAAVAIVAARRAA
jgi:N-methylhydantoinase A